MKKIVFILAFILISTSISTQANAMGIMPVEEESSLELWVNGEKLSFNDYTPEPYMKNGEWMLPLRSILENIGCSIGWNGNTKKIMISKNELQTEVDSNSLSFNDFDNDRVETINGTQIQGNRTFASVEFFEQVTQLDILIDHNKLKVSGMYDIVVDESDLDIVPIVADVPSDYMVDGFYGYGHKVEPSPVNQSEKAIHIIGDNHSDDMFMGFYKELSNLKPNTDYLFKLNFDLATNVAPSMVGIGGSPGSSVYVKAGFVSKIPETLDENNFITLINIDKGNQSTGGVDMKVIGNVEKDMDDYSDAYVYKQFSNYFLSKTDDQGNITLIIGTDSGFEGPTDIYYANISVTTREANAYNLSTIAEKNFELDYVTTTHDGVDISVPKAIHMINTKNEVILNELLDQAVQEAIKGKELGYFYFSYVKKDNGLLSVVFSGSYRENDVSKILHKVVNVDMRTIEVLTTQDFIQNDLGFREVFQNIAMKQGYENLEFNNDMTVYYENNMYIFMFEDSGNSNMIFMDEDLVRPFMRY